MRSKWWIPTLVNLKSGTFLSNINCFDFFPSTAFTLLNIYHLLSKQFLIWFCFFLFHSTKHPMWCSQLPFEAVLAWQSDWSLFIIFLSQKLTTNIIKLTYSYSAPFSTLLYLHQLNNKLYIDSPTKTGVKFLSCGQDQNHCKSDKQQTIHWYSNKKMSQILLVMRPRLKLL